MKHRGINVILAVLAFFFISCSADTGKQGNESKAAPLPLIEFKAQVDTATAIVGDIITLTLAVSSEPQLDVKLSETGSQITGLRIVDAGEESPRLVDNRTVFKKWYKLQPDIVGSYIIPPFTASYKDSAGEEREVKTAHVFIEVKSVLKDKQDGAVRDIVDIKPLQEVPRLLSPLIMYGISLALLACAAGALCFYFYKKKKALPEPYKPAHVYALEELEQLNREQLLERGVVKEYYFRLSEIFRRYIERRFNIPAVERTTEELLPDIFNLNAFGSSIKAETREILRHADLVKFATYCPDRLTTENECRKVVRVIEETKEPVTTPEN